MVQSPNPEYIHVMRSWRWMAAEVMRPPLNYCTQSYVHIDGFSKWEKKTTTVIYFELLIKQKKTQNKTYNVER